MKLSLGYAKSFRIWNWKQRTKEISTIEIKFIFERIKTKKSLRLVKWKRLSINVIKIGQIK